MFKTIFIRFIVSVSLTITLSANAFQAKTVEECEQRFNSTSELSQCLDLVKELTDRELQTWINNQVFILEEFAIVTGRRSALEMFKRSQRNFITYRENNCRWQYLHISPDTGAASAFKKCYVLVTKDRIDELNRLNINKK